MQTIAAIDVGSNAMRITVGRIVYDGKVEAVENLRLPVRLGQDAFTTGIVSEEIAQQAVDAFIRFRKITDDYQVEKIRAVATSAMREMTNSDLLIDRIARSTGIEIEIISGEEEARLIHLAVAQAVNLKGRHALLIDIGGGSVEVTLSQNGNILSTESYNMGTVRLLKKLNGEKNSAMPFHKLAREYAEAARHRIDREIGSKKIDICVGTGGNIEEMGNLRQKLFKRDSDRAITLEELDKLVETLSRMKVEERMRKFKLKPDRADVILPASIVLQMIAHEAKIKEVTIPNVGLKDGVLWDMAYNLQENMRVSPREQVWTSALRLGEKYQFDAEHAKLVSYLAGRLFDQSHALHNLDEENKLLLEVAALLHDIGHFINTVDHNKHGYYILKANPLIGLAENLQNIVANIIQYHRKSIPSFQDDGFRNLPPKDRLVVTELSALMRLADGLDVSHTGRVRDIQLQQQKNTWKLKLQGNGDLMLERWALEKRKRLFQDVFGVKLEIM
ncbi:MAG: Ppx/GppA phosphatase family protein [Anaerolineales bacterium]|nr:Ppx/GppA phosphatase family protein [Anaerolineales bacterium]